MYSEGVMERSIFTNLCDERTKRGVTQESLANAIGVSRQTIIAIEKGKYTPSVALALRLAHHFDLRVEDLFRIKI